ncbi:hypothetical protein SERLADRAFT_362514 [Serpula lacrymans var. lacrymans S7.9]|uniref:DNA mismatch repair proteins mutS family domain-containing protein n=1 Tax=Serpula lacrymans var. lacrymans (strain S7.9) TaxID=578457 RepID=F8P3F5_SERL9|nr:uncharacterized protein SERLADRAFT_362514 [Serpula lacrymans var. lacrymans S7.9]EGO22055.1 hypothetical protein SERLADRAFT_362514 [Serpula lacrymans var. lacrymans S7.9]
MLATEILANLNKFPHCILLTRVGQFYESYFDQAKEVSRLLNIKLTSRVWDKQVVAMCGFPLMHIDKYLKILVQQNKLFVAMCEEFPRPSLPGQKPEFDRRVSRVITPGTLIDEPFLNPYDNNYLLALSAPEITAQKGDPTTSSEVGLAWIDISTGEFFTRTSTEVALRNHLTRINPREIVLNRNLESTHPIRQALMEEDWFVSNAARSPPASNVSFQSDTSTDDITGLSDISSGALPLYSQEESSAIGLLTSYLHANLLEHMPQLLRPNRELTEGRMQMDSNTIKALELRESTREGGTAGSLLNVIKRTTTTGGTRLLSRWLCSPSTSIPEISARQSLVAFFLSRPHLRDDILQLLSDVDDASRIIQKFLLGRGDVTDLLSINATVVTWSLIQQRKGVTMTDHWAGIDQLLSKMTDLKGLSHRISTALENVDRLGKGSSNDSDAIDDDDHAKLLQGPLNVSTNIKYDGTTRWSIRPGFTEQLFALHTTLGELLERRTKLERRLQLTYGAPSLTLRSSPNYGMHVHIARVKRDRAKLKESPAFVCITETGSTCSYFYQEWAQLGSQIVETTVAISAAEKEVLGMLRNEVNASSAHLRKNARIMDELDVTIAFSNLATERNFVRPEVRDDVCYEVTNGRHPTVELGLLTQGRVFTPNSIALNSGSRLQIITGPNMAGKSTLLRQTALLAILAQIGSYVPADHAVVGIVDRLFSRVGAKDDLFRDRSTFMVEMLETAEILRRATPKSLVIMDEVGRGTTVTDGMAIAFATIHHLITVNRCRALFATHFHELAEMLGYRSEMHKGGGIFSEVAFSCTDDSHFAYSHRLRPGVNRNSHGLKVAQLANMPETAISTAKKALSILKGGVHDNISLAERSKLGDVLADL